MKATTLNTKAFIIMVKTIKWCFFVRLENEVSFGAPFFVGINHFRRKFILLILKKICI